MKKSDEFKGVIKTSYHDSIPWWPEEQKPLGPNVLYILLDDAGFSDVGCFGSLVSTPNIDALAADGLRYNNFHVNPMCSPTRASLLSGCYHHACGMGYLSDFDLGFPGYKGNVKKECGFISETLVERGYATYAVGKWHLVQLKTQTGAGPFDQWPLGRGFEKYYGFLKACTSQYYPDLVCGNEFVDQPKMPEEGYHLSEDLVNRAITYIGDLKSNDTEKPFFCYLAFGAQHSPHQAPKEYIDRYKGMFDEGWDVYRQKVFEKQKRLGIIPKNAVLADNDSLVREWDSYTKEEQRALARYMEVYAGFMSHTDAQIGRLVDYLKKIRQYDDTLIVFLHDNGACAAGGVHGEVNDMYHVYTEKDPPLASKKQVELLGSKYTCPLYPAGWAHASNTPYRLYKTWAHCGGIKVPLIISYPNLIKDKGGIRSQYHHVVDINETVLKICGIEQPKYIKGVLQQPKNGVDMSYSFDHPEEPTHRKSQCYEMCGNRGIWADGWKAVANHADNPTFDFSKDKWELFNTDEDYTEMHDLAEKYPEKLRELENLWWSEAGKYNILPMVESVFKNRENFNSRRMLKKEPSTLRKHYTFYPELQGGFGPGRWIYRPFKATAFARYSKGDEGALFCYGNSTGGYALYIHDNKLKFHYNWISFKVFHLESNIELPEGDLELALNIRLTRPNCMIGTLLVNGIPCGEIAMDDVQPLFCAQAGEFRLGRFSKDPIGDDVRDKGKFIYTNKLDRVEFNFENPLTDEDLRKIIKNTAETE